ncbi:MAG: hypothetical protein L0211_24805 [Planctomycetaceae bacterium]|nr:hypothetical protein [Planctomycetaceae bacterium]
MTYRGDIRLGETLDVKFTTRRFSTGAPFTLAGTPAISAYVGNGTTEITAGITLTVDFDARTGLNNVRVVASGANGFATATNVQLVITAGTVDSVSVVGEVVAEFSIENRSALMPATAGSTLAVASGRANADVTHIATAAVSASAAQLGVNVVQAGATAWGSGAITAGSIATGAITSAKFAAGAIDAAAIADDAITDAKVASDVTIASVTGAVGSVTGTLGSLAPQAKADVQAEAEKALRTYHLDHLIESADPGSIVANSSLWAALTSKSATPAYSSYVNTTDSLEAQRDNVGTAGAGLTAIDLPDQTMNITGSLSGSVGSVTGSVGGNVTGSIGSLATQAKADVNAEMLNVVNVVALIDGKTIVQSLIYIGASATGRVSGAGTGTEVFKGLDESTTRLTITVDSSGNRTDIVYG